MKITPMEIRSHHLGRGLRGYDVKEVESLREMAANALETANREVMRLEEKMRGMEEELSEHIRNEKMLKEAITTTQKMVTDIKENARKEAELIEAEARMRGEEIVRQAQDRADDLKDEIRRLRQQRSELNTSIKAIIDYHASTLLLEEEESQRADGEAEKLKFLPK